MIMVSFCGLEHAVIENAINEPSKQIRK
jgi:hypothetical protein